MLVLSASKGELWRMDKHPTCVITVLIVDPLGPNTLCAIPYLHILHLFVHVILSFFSPLKVFSDCFKIDISLSPSDMLTPRPPVLCV